MPIERSISMMGLFCNLSVARSVGRPCPAISIADAPLMTTVSVMLYKPRSQADLSAAFPLDLIHGRLQRQRSRVVRARADADRAFAAVPEIRRPERPAIF